jgi:hypothetical protein
VLFVFFVVSFSSSAETGCPGGICRPQGVPHPAAVRVVVSDSAGGRSYGTGTLVFQEGQQGIVLTCAHLFRPGEGAATVTFPGGRPLPATLLAIDPAWDLSALSIGATEAPAVTVADAYPQAGEPLESCGYGSDGRYWCNRGRALGYARTAGTDTYETLQLTGTARDGDSGGPIFNSRGELVAVLWGTDGRTVAGTYCGRIRAFLARVLPLGRRPQQQPDPLPDALVPVERPPSSENALTAIGRRLDDLSARLDGADQRWDSQRQSLATRLEKIEHIGALVGSLRERIDSGKAVAGDDRGAGGLGGVILALLPQVLAALGWTGPPSIAALLAVRLAVGLIRRKKAAGKRGSNLPDNHVELNDNYARQLADVFALSGRSPLADATLGREYDEELRRAEESSDGTLAAWAKKLRSNVATRFYRIHGAAPTPAEPVT